MKTLLATCHTVVNSYTDIFNARGHSYNEATNFAPNARFLERQLLIDRLCANTNSVVLDAPAGGGYLADGIPLAKRMYCMEPSYIFGKPLQSSRHQLLNGSLEQMPVKNSCIDRVGSLAGLHHLPSKQVFFDETYRVLRPKGIVAVADVQVKTPSALFLNDTVNRLTETGHHGIFFEQNEMTLNLEAAGFSHCTEELLKCPWLFDKKEHMVTFCTLLFGLVNASPAAVLSEIENNLNVSTKGGKIQLGWSLVYAVGQKL